MTFEHPAWRPIAGALTAINLMGIGWAAAMTEPAHAVVHGVLAVAFGLGGRHLQQRRVDEERRQLGPGAPQAGLLAREAEMDGLRQELMEAQERLDFAERVLARTPEVRVPEARRPDPGP